MIKKGRVLILVLAGVLSVMLIRPAQAQLSVVQGAAMGMTPQQLVQNYLVGAGITISNVTFNGASTNITSDQVGTFSATGMAANQLGLAGGILMTTGKANIAIGPNNATGAGNNTGGSGDPDLNAISGTSTFDKAVIEFDFIPQFDTIRFRYVFASEEFFEFCNQINDAFGFFLSGPGITGTYSNNSTNIARMPGSLSLPVTINNICANSLSRWTNPNGGLYYQYDGLTYVYTAWYVVTPCTTYHIKLAIGDAVDHILDSGVFLEENSFSSPGVSLVNNNTIPALQNTAVEGCNDVHVNFRLMATMNYPYKVNFTIGGSAVNGVDYTHIDDFVIFPPGEDSVDVVIHPINDNIPEGIQDIVFTLNQISCDGTIEQDTIYIDDYVPLTIDPNHDTTMCYGGEIELKANTEGGIAPLTYLWSFSASTDSTVIYLPPVGNNVLTVKVTDVCNHHVGDTALALVHPVPVADAGTSITIPNGTSTTLHGSASGGYGNYQYTWSSNPPGFSSTQQNPPTGNLSHTTLFILKVTDVVSGCESPPAQVMVIIEGGPLSVNPVAVPQEICLGDTAQLYSLSGGGSGLYTYQWSSDPGSFLSTLPDPLVSPVETTTYHVSVNDGFNQLSGSTFVTVNPLPEIRLGPADTTACIYDTVTLDAGNPGSLYKWSDGTTGRYKTLATTGIGYDIQTYSVTVTNTNGCKNKATITVIFTFDGCVGIEELQQNLDYIVWPNPATTNVQVKILRNVKQASIELINLTGSRVWSSSVIRRHDPDMVHEIDISDFPRGLYFMRITTPDGRGSMKLIIN